MKRRALAAVLAAAVLTACGQGPPADGMSTLSFTAMDTVMELQLQGDRALGQEVQRQIEALETAVSVTREGSAVYQANHTGQARLTGPAAELMEQALALCRRTGGALDVSVYPVVRAWGFTTGDYAVPSQQSLTQALEKVDYQALSFDRADGALTLPEGMEIDLGSVAKGFAGREAAELLRSRGVTSALLSLGGNVQTVGGRADGSPWRVGIRSPWGEGLALILSVRDKAVVTSGGYERYFQQDGETYWHIMDPATGRPARSGLVSVTVVGDDGLVCDALSTALYVMGLEKAADFWRQSDDFQAVFISQDGSVTLTQGLEEAYTLPEGPSPPAVEILRR